MNRPADHIARTAAADIDGYLIIAYGANDDAVPANGASAPMFAISNNLGARNGQRVDCITGGTPEVRYGGVVAAGDPLTADTQGRAVAAAPAAGVNARIIGFAAVSGNADDIGAAHIAPGIMQG